MKVAVTYDLSEDDLAAIKLSIGEIGRANREQSQTFLRHAVETQLAPLRGRLQKLIEEVAGAGS